MTGSELRSIRMELGMTQAQFGDRVGYSEKGIANFENGRQVISKALESHAQDLLALHRIKMIVKPDST